MTSKCYTLPLSRTLVAAMFALIGCISTNCSLLGDTLGTSSVVFTPSTSIKVGPNSNFSGLNLKGSEFYEMDLGKADFSDCSLRLVKIVNCNLATASFNAAHLSEAIIDSCEISQADFTNSIINGMVNRAPNELCDFHLSEAQLKSTKSYRDRDLSHCLISGRFPTEGNWPKYEFKGASLRGAVLASGDFSNCDFTDADLTAARFHMARVNFDSLSRCKAFKERQLNQTRFEGCRVYGHCDFSGMKLIAVTFSAEHCDSLNLSDATLEEGYFKGIDAEQLKTTRSYRLGKLAKITFDRCDLSGCDFSDADLSGVNFLRCNLKDSLFEDSVISGARFTQWLGDPESPATGMTASQIRSTWNYKNRHMDGVTLPEDVAGELVETD